MRHIPSKSGMTFAMQRRACRLVLAALMIHLCALGAPASEPKQKWMTVTSAHFSVVTDGDVHIVSNMPLPDPREATSTDLPHSGQVQV